MTRENLSLAALAAGFLVLGGGIYTAVRAPATAYELSIYRATPPTFWIACGVALTIAVAVAVSSDGSGLTPAALFLAGTSLLAVTSLPVVRGYYFYGLGDALTHLGWARELAGGASPFDLFYPASHLIAGAVATLGYDVRYAMLLVVVVFTLLFFLFVPLTIRTLGSDSDGRAIVIGSIAALLLLPLFNLGTSYLFVPFTLGTLFLPLVLFLFARLVVLAPRTGTGAARSRLKMKGLLSFAGTTLLLIHSQVLLDLLILLGTVVAIQVGVRRYRGSHPVTDHPSVVGPTLFLGGLFAVWNAFHETAFSAAAGVLNALLGGQVAAVVQRRGDSLQAVGGSLVEMFAKLFLVNTVFVIVAAILLVAVLLGRRCRLSESERTFTMYVGIGGIVLFPFALLHFVGSASTLFFRHVGFGMVLVTLLGGLGLVSLVRREPSLVRPLIAVGAVVGIVLSAAILFPSPYIYLSNPQVTEQQMQGYEATFDHRASGTTFAGVRGGAERFSSADPQTATIEGRDVNATMIDEGLPSTLTGDTYVVVTETDRRRELIAFEELRYSEETFRTLSTQRGVSRIRANGQVEVFYVGG